MRVSQGFWGTREHWQNIEGNNGILANFWEQGNKIRKITVRKHSESVETWEHRAILEGNKGTMQGPPWETLRSDTKGVRMLYHEKSSNLIQTNNELLLTVKRRKIMK